MAAKSLEQFIKQNNFKLLMAQKTIFVNLMGKSKLTDAENAMMEGLIHLIDEVQDIAVDTFGYPKRKVLNLSDDNDKPVMTLAEAKKIVLKSNEEEIEDDIADEIYFQPVLTDEEWETGNLASFEVYRSYEKARQDYPGKQIAQYKNEEIEDHTYVD